MLGNSTALRMLPENVKHSDYDRRDRLNRHMDYPILAKTSPQ
jgi:hypothetical protein